VQESDAKGFDRALSRLCAGFDVPVTDARREAYWRAFRKLTVLEFAGLVDTALVESTFASMPTVGALRELHRKVQSPDTSAAPASDGPSIQAQLCEYAAMKLAHLIRKTATPAERWQYSRPWTYVYREWRENGKQCAECIGVVIDLDNGKRIGWRVSDMQGDIEGYEAMMRKFRPGPRPIQPELV
jgi:hypothetical protein